MKGAADYPTISRESAAPFYAYVNKFNTYRARNEDKFHWLVWYNIFVEEIKLIHKETEDEDNKKRIR